MEVQELKGDGLLDALTAGLGWSPLSLTSSAVAIGYGAPVRFELRAAMVPQAMAAASGKAIQFVELKSLGAVAGSHAAAAPTAEAVVREALFIKAQADLDGAIKACDTANAWSGLVRSAGLTLGRIEGICAEVTHLSQRVPVAAEVHSSGAVAITAVYSFFTSRTRFALHLLVSSSDPNEPIAWQVTADPDASGADKQEQQQQPSGAAGGASSTAIVPSSSLSSKVAAAVSGHLVGFGRLPAIHAALTSVFAPSL